MSERQEISAAGERRLNQIAHAYPLYRADLGLKDTPLVRMSYFSNIKKEFLDDPLELEEDQFEILDHLDMRMRQTQKEIDKLPPVIFARKIAFETDYSNDFLKRSIAQ